MKKLSILLLVLIVSKVYSQSPQSFKYQAVLRDNSGVLLLSKNVSVQISILKGSIEGVSTYTEKHTATTSTTGIINLEIGKGTLLSGSFKSIEWGKATYFIKVEMDPKAGSTYELVGVAQLLSVPYALYADKSGDEKWSQSGNDIYYNLGKIGINSTLPATKLEINGGGDLDVLGIRNENNSSGLTNTVASNSDFHASAFIGKKSRGTLLNPTMVQAGDRITGLYGRSFANGEYQNSAAIQMYVGASPGSLSYPTNIRFETTGTGQVDRTERMRITESGNVGIGTSSPSSKLDVSGSINATQYLLNGSPVNFSSGPQWGTSGTSIYYNTGNVGIGVASPNVKLDIDGGTNLDLLNLRNSNNSLGVNASVYSSTDFHGSALIGKRARGSYASPSTPLNGDRITGIYGSIYANNDFQNAGAVHMYVGANPGASSYPVNIRFETTNTNETTRLERMRITEEGNIGIGTTTPASKLDVSGGVNATQYLLNGAPISFSSGQPQQWGVTGSNLFYNTGKIGIGLNSPSVKLDIDGGTDLDVLNIRNANNSLGINASVYSNTDFHGSALIGRRARGSYASPSSPANGDRITGIYGSIYANNDFQNAGAVHMYVGANPSSFSYPVNIRFETTNTNETIRKERMRITENGLVKVTTSDVYIEHINSGVIMKSPNGDCWRMTVSDTGTPLFTAITCPQ